MIFPPPDATYSQIQAWRRARSGDPAKDWSKCAACGKRTRAAALCAGHQTEPVA